MILSPMRFNGYTWLHNPIKIDVQCNNATKELKIPNSNSVLQNFGRKSRIIKGTGYLIGKDCYAQYKALWDLYINNKRGILSIPDIGSFNATFTQLNCIGEKNELLTYSFTFIEDYHEEKGKVITTHIVEDNQDMWDISYKYDIDIKRLMELNSDIPRPDKVPQGSKVVLC